MEMMVTARTMAATRIASRRARRTPEFISSFAVRAAIGLMPELPLPRGILCLAQFRPIVDIASE